MGTDVLEGMKFIGSYDASGLTDEDILFADPRAEELLALFPKKIKAFSERMRNPDLSHEETQHLLNEIVGGLIRFRDAVPATDPLADRYRQEIQAGTLDGLRSVSRWLTKRPDRQTISATRQSMESLLSPYSCDTLFQLAKNKPVSGFDKQINDIIRARFAAADIHERLDILHRHPRTRFIPEYLIEDAINSADIDEKIRFLEDHPHTKLIHPYGFIRDIGKAVQSESEQQRKQKLFQYAYRAWSEIDPEEPAIWTILGKIKDPQFYYSLNPEQLHAMFDRYIGTIGRDETAFAGRQSFLEIFASRFPETALRHMPQIFDSLVRPDQNTGNKLETESFISATINALRRNDSSGITAAKKLAWAFVQYAQSQENRYTDPDAIPEISAGDIERFYEMPVYKDTVTDMLHAFEILIDVSESSPELTEPVFRTVKHIIQTQADPDVKSYFLVRIPQLARIQASRTGSREYFDFVIDTTKELDGQTWITGIVGQLMKYDDRFDDYRSEFEHTLRTHSTLKPNFDAIDINYPERMKRQFRPVSQAEANRLSAVQYTRDVVGFEYPHNDRGFDPEHLHDNNYAIHIMPFREPDGTLTSITDILASHERDGGRPLVVDIGCGFRARALTDLKKRFPHLRGIGISGNVIEPTGRLTETQMESAIELHQANIAFAGEFLGTDRKGTADVVTCISTLQYPADAWGTIQEMVSLLKPGGTAFINIRYSDFRTNSPVYDGDGNEVSVEKLLSTVNMLDDGFEIQWGIIRYPGGGHEYTNLAITIRKNAGCLRNTLPLPLYYAQLNNLNRLGYLYIHPANRQTDLTQAFNRVGSALDPHPLPAELRPKEFTRIVDAMEHGPGVACVIGGSHTGKSTLAAEVELYFETGTDYAVFHYDGHQLMSNDGGKGLRQILDSVGRKPAVLIIDAADYLYSRLEQTDAGTLAELLDTLDTSVNSGLKLYLTRHGEDWDKINEISDLKKRFMKIITGTNALTIQLHPSETRVITYNAQTVEPDQIFSDRDENVLRNQKIVQDLEKKSGGLHEIIRSGQISYDIFTYAGSEPYGADTVAFGETERTAKLTVVDPTGNTLTDSAYGKAVAKCFQTDTDRIVPPEVIPEESSGYNGSGILHLATTVTCEFTPEELHWKTYGDTLLYIEHDGSFYPVSTADGKGLNGTTFHARIDGTGSVDYFPTDITEKASYRATTIQGIQSDTLSANYLRKAFGDHTIQGLDVLTDGLASEFFHWQPEDVAEIVRGNMLAISDGNIDWDRMTPLPFSGRTELEITQASPGSSPYDILTDTNKLRRFLQSRNMTAADDGTRVRIIFS